MLNDVLKEDIQGAYSRLLEEKGYKARSCQKSMIAEIARTIGGASEETSPVCVVEAGTGTGKTIAYAIATIPIAQHLKKKIVIATATVALQEQIIYQDLPDIRKHSGLDFSFALAKGRRRYLCLSKLDNALQGSSSMSQTLSMFDEGMPGMSGNDGPSVDAGPLFEQMLNRLGRGEWDGDKDSWPEEIEPVTWSRVSTDHAQCTGRQCSHYENCYFYKAREDIHRVDCIVTNQDLVLSDLMMGGGAVLPDPEDTIYIFDEGHHLPDKAGNHFSHVFSIYSTKGWLMQMPSTFQLASADLPIIHGGTISAAEAAIEALNLRLDEVAAELQSHKEDADVQDDGWRYRFPLGRVDTTITKFAAAVAAGFTKLQGMTETLIPRIEEVLEDTAPADRDEIERWLSIIAAIDARLIAAISLWQNFSIADMKPPYARWVKYVNSGPIEGLEIQLSCHPVSVSEELDDRLWSRCAGAIVTSATISVGQDFSGFQKRSGVSPESRFVSLASPFRFREQGVLRVPAMQTDPSDADAHTEELATLIPEMIENEPGSLVLFTSWRQMLRVYDEIDTDFRERVLLQGGMSKLERINRHRASIDKGAPSCIFGLASFSEGVDLPGEYCSHVVIAKIPFSVPDDPVDATLSEWIEDSGGNSFYELMLPNAAIRIVQAAGRLLRTETDRGTVTILDRRVVSKSYGKIILDALPPFAREIH
jgi:ATP-dependent DNA helicase DinG